jgi:hypothetical protein
MSFALELEVLQALRQRKRYMVVGRDVKGRLVFFDNYESDIWPLPFRADSINDATAICTSKREVERAFNGIRRELKYLFPKPESDRWRDMDHTTVETLRIIEIGLQVQVVLERSRKAKSAHIAKDGWPANSGTLK